MDLTILFLLIMFTLSVSMLFIALAVYFLPLIIAYSRRHKNTLAIFILLIAIGWTFLGWLGALLWSLNGDINKTEADD